MCRQDLNNPTKGTAALFAEILGRGLQLRFSVAGASMAPLVRSGDAVTVMPAGARALRPGDLVLFVNSRGRLVLHRIVRIDSGPGGEPLFRTKGDGQGMFDEPVAPAAVLGKVRRIERGRRGLAGRVIALDSSFWRFFGPVLARVHRGVNRLWTVFFFPREKDGQNP